MKGNIIPGLTVNTPRTLKAFWDFLQYEFFNTVVEPSTIHSYILHLEKAIGVSPREVYRKLYSRHKFNFSDKTPEESYLICLKRTNQIRILARLLIELYPYEEVKLARKAYKKAKKLLEKQKA